MYPFERFTEGAKQALTRAQEEAVAAHERYIGTEHIALALASDEGAAGRVLRDLGITYDGMKARVAAVLADRSEAPRTIIPTSRTKRVVELAFQEATSAGAASVGTGHLLVAPRYRVSGARFAPAWRRARSSGAGSSRRPPWRRGSGRRARWARP